MIDWMREPEKFEECDRCNGYGSSLKEPDERCSKCGGSGCVPKEEGES